jgi:hypothetical protein
VKLIAWLCQEMKIDASQIAGHKDRAPKQTDCPGKDMYRYIEDGQIRGWVTEILEGKTPDIELLPPLPGGPTTMIGEVAPTTAPAPAQ